MRMLCGLCLSLTFLTTIHAAEKEFLARVYEGKSAQQWAAQLEIALKESLEAPENIKRALVSLQLDSVPALHELLKKSNDRTLGVVAEILHEINRAEDETAAILLPFLKHPDFGFRRAALLALAPLHSHPTVEPAIRLATKDRDVAVAEVAERILTKSPAGYSEEVVATQRKRVRSDADSAMDSLKEGDIMTARGYLEDMRKMQTKDPEIRDVIVTLKYKVEAAEKGATREHRKGTAKKTRSKHSMK